MLIALLRLCSNGDFLYLLCFNFLKMPLFGCSFCSASPLFSYLWLLEDQPNSPIDTRRYQNFAISPLHRAPRKILYMQSLNASLLLEFLDFFILTIGHKVTIDSWLSIPTQISITQVWGGWYQIQMIWRRRINSIYGTECSGGPKTPTASFLGFYNNVNDFHSAHNLPLLTASYTNGKTYSKLRM